jgi:hypothetical protein
MKEEKKKRKTKQEEQGKEKNKEEDRACRGLHRSLLVVVVVGCCGLLWLSCRGCPVLVVLSWLSCLGMKTEKEEDRAVGAYIVDCSGPHF